MRFYGKISLRVFTYSSPKLNSKIIVTFPLPCLVPDRSQDSPSGQFHRLLLRIVEWSSSQMTRKPALFKKIIQNNDLTTQTRTISSNASVIIFANFSLTSSRVVLTNSPLWLGHRELLSEIWLCALHAICLCSLYIWSENRLIESIASIL